MIQDRAGPGPRANYARARKAEYQYAARLRAVAVQIGMILRGTAADPMLAATIMENYAEVLTPWAEAVANSMLADVARRDEVTWFEVGKQIGRSIRTELASSPTGIVFQEQRAAQVRLIKSIPIEAAERVRLITQEMLSTGGRAETLAAQLMATEHVSRGRANTIARTEVAKSHTMLTQIRAEHLGSPGYTWLTAKDGNVRPSHAKMQGKFVSWDNPPTLDGMTGHAGALINCRCVPATILPE